MLLAGFLGHAGMIVTRKVQQTQRLAWFNPADHHQTGLISPSSARGQVLNIKCKSLPDAFRWITKMENKVKSGPPTLHKSLTPHLVAEPPQGYISRYFEGAENESFVVFFDPFFQELMFNVSFSVWPSNCLANSSSHLVRFRCPWRDSHHSKCPEIWSCKCLLNFYSRNIAQPTTPLGSTGKITNNRKQQLSLLANYVCTYKESASVSWFHSRFGK